MFMDAVRDNILENHNVSITENGAIGYETTGKNLLDLNFSVASLRNVSEVEIAERFYKAFLEDKNLAMRWLFFARDVRGGLGERRLFRSVIKALSTEEPEVVKAIIPLFTCLTFISRDLGILPMFSDVYFLVLELITPDNAYPEVSNELRCLLNSQVRNPVEVCTEHERDKSEPQ